MSDFGIGMLLGSREPIYWTLSRPGVYRVCFAKGVVAFSPEVNAREYRMFFWIVRLFSKVR